jgi:hypothetical protein
MSYYTGQLHRGGWVQLWANSYAAAVAQLQDRAERTGDTVKHPPQWHRSDGSTP